MTGLHGDGARLAPSIALSILDSVDTMVVVTDRDGTIVYVNPAFTAVTGYDAAEAVGQTPRLLRSGLQDEPFYAELWSTVLAGERWHGELVNRRKDGTLYTDEMTITPVGGEGAAATHFIAVKRDVSTRLDTMTSASPTGIAHLAADGRLLYANRRTEVLLGASVAELAGSGWRAHLDPAAVDAARDARRRHPGGAGIDVELAEGRILRLRAGPLVLADGTSLGDVLSLDDVTDEVRLRESSEANARFVREVLDTLDDHTAVVDRRGTILLTNRSWDRFADLNGGDPGATGIGANYLQVCRRSAAAGSTLAGLVADELAGVLAGARQSADHEYPCGSPDEERWFQLRIRPMPGGGAVLSHTDITWRRQATERLAFLASHDALTGVLNRSGLRTALDQALQRGEAVTVLFVDLDRFKDVNDRLGHAAGDALLEKVASRLRRGVRAADVVGRLGGDEFVVVVDGDEEVAAPLAERLSAALTAPYQLGGHVATVGATIGVAPARPGGTVDDVLQAADRAMYLRKPSREPRADG